MHWVRMFIPALDAPIGMARSEGEEAIDRSKIEDYAAGVHRLDRLARAGEGAGEIYAHHPLDLFRDFDPSHKRRAVRQEKSLPITVALEPGCAGSSG